MYDSKLQKDLSKLVKDLKPTNIEKNFELVAQAITVNRDAIKRKMLANNFGTGGYLSIEHLKEKSDPQLNYDIPDTFEKKIEQPPYTKTLEMLKNIRTKISDTQLKNYIKTISSVFKVKALTKNNTIMETTTLNNKKMVKDSKVDKSSIINAYAKIGKLAKNNQISAKKVLNLMKPGGLLDLETLGSQDISLFQEGCSASINDLKNGVKKSDYSLDLFKNYN